MIDKCKWSPTISKGLVDLAGSDPPNTYRSVALAALLGEIERLAQIPKRCTANITKSSPPEELARDAQSNKSTRDTAAKHI